IRANVNRPSYLILWTSGSRPPPAPRCTPPMFADGDVRVSSAVAEKRRAVRSNGRARDKGLTSAMRLLARADIPVPILEVRRWSSSGPSRYDKGRRAALHGQAAARELCSSVENG